MGMTSGKQKTRRRIHFLFLPLSFFLVEVFAFLFLSLNTEEFRLAQLWPLASALVGGDSELLCQAVPGQGGESGVRYFVFRRRNLRRCADRVFLSFFRDDVAVGFPLCV